MEIEPGAKYRLMCGCSGRNGEGGETILWGKRERKGKTFIGRLGVCVCV